MTSSERMFSIGDVSARTGLSVDTLRFYEREALLPPIERTVGGRRVFSEDDVGWIGICQRLRASGMPLTEVAKYAALVAAGTGNESQRLELLKAHEVEVRSQLAALQDALDLITMKVSTYTDALERGRSEGLFEHDQDDDAYFAAVKPDRVLTRGA
ncbi:DNA-binding transcriptional MerR regulator [Curtobacterium sp. PhB25]|uniref:MerR family transcriptional regulator n=1 Tax=Curtobacterium sp. PhB25 TaxID=2485205 RepID=UPI0010669498|nr:MerR family transcriptional regulator [Curtobacterium sp. PhB25]TDW64173.1 DNA-binding transcriptional MerR regulator [Curtobacterium sp. PhB25]